MEDGRERESRHGLKLIGSAFFRFAVGVLIQTRFAKVRFDSIRLAPPFRPGMRSVSVPTKECTFTTGSKRKSYRLAKKRGGCLHLCRCLWTCVLEFYSASHRQQVVLYGRQLFHALPEGKTSYLLGRLLYHHRHLPTSVAFRQCHLQLPTAATHPGIGMRLFATNPWLCACGLFDDGLATATD